MGTEIVVVEDDEGVRDLVAYRLRTDGFDVTTYEDGRAAWEALVSRASPPDAVVTDVMLPGIDGLTLLRRIRGHDGLASVPVILLTSRGLESDVTEAFASGATDYLTKPFRPNELLARVRRVVG